MKSNGAVLYRGPSLLDGAPIVTLLTGLARPTANAKTGDMLQTWILRADQSPSQAVASGTDSSICGTCRHRGDEDAPRTCYVLVQQAPRAVFQAWRKGAYLPAAPALADHLVRLGSYGDPAAVPQGVWRALVRNSRGWTGYTHAWRAAPHLRDLCMASVDSPAELQEARALGWRCFLVAPPGTAAARSPKIAREHNLVPCPASKERGNRTTCAACRLCQGTASTTTLDIVIGGHGSAKKGLPQWEL